jgi:hypothetical protein
VNPPNFLENEHEDEDEDEHEHEYEPPTANP